MKIIYPNTYINTAYIVVLLSNSAVANTQENNSFLGGVLHKGSTSPVMSINIFPNAPASQAGRAYNKPVGGTETTRDVFQKISPFLPLAELGSEGAKKTAGDMMAEGISIKIPQVDFGFKGRLSGKNVCIRYKKTSHKCDNDTVSIEEYTTFILKGSYKSEEVSGTFFIVQPWRNDSSFTIPVNDLLKKGSQDLNSLVSSVLRKMRNEDKKPSTEDTPTAIPSVGNAFLITTDHDSHVCFENMLEGENPKLKEKYSQGIKVFAKSANSGISVANSCPQPALNYCDGTDGIRQYFYEKARTKGNENLQHSRITCEKNGGKWF